MRDILRQLNHEYGASGSMVITPDGIMVSSVMTSEYEEESMAAFISSILLGVKRSLRSLGAPEAMTSCQITADNTKVMFFCMRNSYLVVVTDPTHRHEQHAEIIAAAMDRITNRRIA